MYKDKDRDEEEGRSKEDLGKGSGEEGLKLEGLYAKEEKEAKNVSVPCHAVWAGKDNRGRRTQIVF